MLIQNLGAFTAGLARGDLAASEEQRKREQQDFAREQQQAWREAQKREEAQRQAFAGVRRPGDYEVQSYRGMTGGLDMEDMPRETERISVSDEDFARGLARASADPSAALGFLNTAGQLNQQARVLRANRDMDAALARYRASIDEFRRDPEGFLTRNISLFNADKIGGPEFAGQRVALQRTPQGNQAIIIGPDNNVIGTMPITPQTVEDTLARLVSSELGSVSPEVFFQNQGRRLQERQVGAAETTAAAAASRADTEGQYRRDLAGRPLVQNDGSGRIVVLDPTGSRVIGTYGAPRPEPGAGMGAGRMPQLLGATQDGQLIVMTPQGIRTQPMPPGVTAGDIFPRASGVRPKPGTSFQAQREQLLARLTGDNFQQTQEALASIDAQESRFLLEQRLADLPPEERVPELRKLIAQGATLEALRSFGFTPRELREASKPAPAAPAASPAPAAPAGISRPAPAAPAQRAPSVDISDAQLMEAVRTNGVTGVGAALLGPRPTGRFAGDRAAAWDAANQELLQRARAIGQAQAPTR